VITAKVPEQQNKDPTALKPIAEIRKGRIDTAGSAKFREVEAYRLLNAIGDGTRAIGNSQRGDEGKGLDLFVFKQGLDDIVA